MREKFFQGIKHSKSDVEANWLNEYAILQYNNLFDSENMNTTFFEINKE